MSNHEQPEISEIVAELAKKLQPPEPTTIHFPTPDRFNGNQKKYRDFHAAVENYFELKSTCFRDDRMKTGFVGSLLTDHALTWYRRLTEQNSECLRDYSKFSKEMEIHFGNPFVQSTAQRELLTLRQKGSAVAYSADFQRISLDSGHNDVTLMALYKKGLKKEIQNAITINARDFETLDSLVEYAIRVDNDFYEQRMESTLRPESRKLPTINWSLPSPQRTPRTSTTSSTGSPHLAPMDLDSVSTTHRKLTPEQKAFRYKNNLCLYCGKPGHRALACPNKQAKPRLETADARTLDSQPLEGSDQGKGRVRFV